MHLSSHRYLSFNEFGETPFLHILLDDGLSVLFTEALQMREGSRWPEEQIFILSILMDSQSEPQPKDKSSWGVYRTIYMRELTFELRYLTKPVPTAIVALAAIELRAFLSATETICGYSVRPLLRLVLRTLSDSQNLSMTPTEKASLPSIVGQWSKSVNSSGSQRAEVTKLLQSSSSQPSDSTSKTFGMDPE